MTIDEAIALFGRECEAIWLEQPEEIRILSRGESARGVGSRGQYLTPLMFAEGTARSLADETMWVIHLMCDRPETDLATLKVMITELVSRKAGFFELFGLEHASELIRTYIAVAQTAQDLAELQRLTDAALAYANRIHVWLDAAFPWGVCTGFMRAGYGTRNADGLEQGAKQ
jgi:hypothetical protein